MCISAISPQLDTALHTLRTSLILARIANPGLDAGFSQLFVFKFDMPDKVARAAGAAEEKSGKGASTVPDKD